MTNNIPKLLSNAPISSIATKPFLPPSKPKLSKRPYKAIMNAIFLKYKFL